MKLANIFLIQAIAQIIGGILLISNVDIFCFKDDFTNPSLAMMRFYGISILLMGGISIQIYKYFDYSPLFKMSSLIFMLSHVLMGFHMMGLYQGNIVSLPVLGFVHLFFALIFAFVYYKESDKFQ